VAEAGAQHEGNTFINGTAANRPEGFLNNSDIQVVNSTIADSFDADGLMDLAAELKTGYRDPLYIMSRRTINHVRKLKDGSGAYLLVGLRDGLPNTINGYPYREMPDMPEIAADALPVAFGEFRRGYVIVDRMGMTMVRDIYTQKRKRIIELTFHKRVGGQVILPEAIKILKCAA
jgi:HK97 family phage major capsid protein